MNKTFIVLKLILILGVVGYYYAAPRLQKSPTHIKDHHSNNCPPDQRAWQTDLDKIADLNQHSYTWFWLASARSGNLIDFNRSKRYANQSVKRAQRLRQCPSFDHSLDELITLERSANRQLNQLQSFIDESQETHAGYLPLFLSLTQQPLYYSFYDNPKETAVRHSVQTLIQDYQAAIMRKLVEPYVLVLVCTRVLDPSAQLDHCQISQESQILSAVVRHYLSEESSAYVLTPLEEGQHIEDFNHFRREFAHFVKNHNELKQPQKDTLNKIAEAYQTPKVSVLMLMEQDDVDDVSYFGLFFYTWDQQKQSFDHIKNSYGTLYTDGFAEDVSQRKYLGVIFILLLVLFISPLLMLIIRKLSSDPYTKEAPLYLSCIFTTIALVNAYIATVLIGSFGISNTDFAPTLSKTYPYLFSLSTLQLILSGVFFNLLASRWSKLGLSFYYKDTVTTMILSTLLGFLGLLSYFAIQRSIFDQYIFYIGLHLLFALIISYQCGHSLSQYLKLRHNFNINQLWTNLLILLSCAMCLIIWQQTPYFIIFGLILFSILSSKYLAHSEVKKVKITEDDQIIKARSLTYSMNHLIQRWKRECITPQDSNLNKVHIHWLSGDEGVGKTALIKYFEEYLHLNGESTYFLYGQCTDQDHQLSRICPPFAQAFQEHLGYKYFENPTFQLNQLNQHILSHKILGTLKPIQMITEVFGGRSWGGADIEASLDTLEESVNASFKELLREKPVIFVIDDAHLIDQESVKLLERIIEALNQQHKEDPLAHQITFFMVYQYETHPIFHRMKRQMTLNSFTDHDSTHISLNDSFSQSESAHQKLILPPSLPRLLRDHFQLSYDIIVPLLELVHFRERHPPKISHKLYQAFKTYYQHRGDLNQVSLIDLSRAPQAFQDHLLSYVIKEIEDRYQDLSPTTSKLLFVCSYVVSKVNPSINPSVIALIMNHSEWEVIQELDILRRLGWLDVTSDQYRFRNTGDHELLKRVLQKNQKNQPLVTHIHRQRAQYLFERWHQYYHNQDDLQGDSLLIQAFIHAEHLKFDPAVNFYQIAYHVTQMKSLSWSTEVMRASLHVLHACKQGVYQLKFNERAQMIGQYLWYLDDTQDYQGWGQDRVKELLNTFDPVDFWVVNNKNKHHSLEKSVQELLTAKEQLTPEVANQLQFSLTRHQQLNENRPFEFDQKTFEILQGEPTDNQLVEIFIKLIKRNNLNDQERLKYIEQLYKRVEAHQDRDQMYPLWIQIRNKYAKTIKEIKSSGDVKKQHIAYVKALNLFAETYQSLHLNPISQDSLSITENQYADALYDFACSRLDHEANLLEYELIDPRSITSTQGALKNTKLKNTSALFDASIFLFQRVIKSSLESQNQNKKARHYSQLAWAYLSYAQYLIQNTHPNEHVDIHQVISTLHNARSTFEHSVSLLKYSIQGDRAFKDSKRLLEETSRQSLFQRKGLYTLGFMYISYSQDLIEQRSDQSKEEVNQSKEEMKEIKEEMNQVIYFACTLLDHAREIFEYGFDLLESLLSIINSHKDQSKALSLSNDLSSSYMFLKAEFDERFKQCAELSHCHNIQEHLKKTEIDFDQLKQTTHDRQDQHNEIKDLIFDLIDYLSETTQGLSKS